MYLFPDMNTLDSGSVTFTLERKPEHHEEKPVVVVEKEGRDRWSRKIELNKITPGRLTVPYSINKT